MPIYSHHPLYDEMLPTLKRAQDATSGSRAIKHSNNATDYLPPLDRQSPIEYRRMVERAVWFGATGRTVDAMRGIATRTEPTISLPAPLLAMVDSGGNGGLIRVVHQLVHNMLVGGVSGILADAPVSGGSCYLVTFPALSIINWQRDPDEGRYVYVVIEGSSYIQAGDMFEKQARTHYLLLGLDEEGNYFQETFFMRESREWKSDGRIYPTKSGQRLKEIPFFLCGEFGNDPPISPLAEVNILHYNNSANYEDGARLTARPKPYVLGVSEQELGDAFLVGSSYTFAHPDTQVKLGYMEFSGAGLGSLLEAMAHKERLMAQLGAKIIAPARTGVETAETARIHEAGQNASLADVSFMCSMTMQDALRFCAQWEGANPDSVQFEMATDFVDARLTAQELTALVQAYLDGGISLDTLTYNLKTGEMLPRGTSPDDERDKILGENPDMRRSDA